MKSPDSFHGQVELSAVLRHGLAMVVPPKRCFYCGAFGRPLTVDHRTPRTRGGSNRISNLCWSCEPCNFEKGDMTVREYRRWLRAQGRLHSSGQFWGERAPQDRRLTQYLRYESPTKARP